jgi:hypothetical protein
LLHGYAGTAHIAQGITTGRAFVLGSDIAYREWGYVAWSRARIQTRFYVCEPDVDEIAEEHHTAIAPERDAFEQVVAALERSQAQHAAFELGERVANGPGRKRVLRDGHGSRPEAEAALATTDHRDVDEASTTTAHIRGRPAPDAAAGDAQNGEPVVPRGLAARRDPPAYLVGELGERPLNPAIASSGEDQVLWVSRCGSASQSGPSKRPEQAWRLPERRADCG